jgi:threonine dehydrogenase-like Zn-dependent dehydrogenase
MKAVTFHGKRDVRVDNVPDPTIEEPTDAIIRVTSTGLSGSDLHLYEVMGAFMDEGDVLGHEPIGIVEAVGSEVTQIKPGDRVVIPFNIACGTTCRSIRRRGPTRCSRRRKTGSSRWSSTRRPRDQSVEPCSLNKQKSRRAMSFAAICRGS